MCHTLMARAVLSDPRFYRLLSKFDADLAEQIRSGRCPLCGGRLDGASYPRKPRGGPDDLGEDYQRRWSFCCAVEGCRRRTTPPSVRFLGRKVYLGAVLVLVSALRYGPTPPRAAQLKEWFGVSGRTLERWRTWWLTTFAASPFWRMARGLLRQPAEPARLPCSLLEAFPTRGEHEPWASALRFLSPITTTSAAIGQGFRG